jgi:L-ascorbate metabolism protein UlaG (beta-lactamase superfamily)
MVELQFFGHSFFKLKGANGSIVVDPHFSGKRAPSVKSLGKLDAVLITNETARHLDKTVVEKLATTNNCPVVGHEVALDNLDISKKLKVPIASDKEVTFKKLNIKSKGAHFPESFYPMGYLVDFGDKKVYHPGATSLLETFHGTKADVFLVPINGRMMDVADAIRASKIIKPTHVIPMIYDSTNELKVAQKFKEKMDNSVLKAQTTILEPGQKFKI